MRILFCTNSLGAKGGIEMVTIVKANALADINGNEVAVCFTDKGTYPDDMIHPLSEKVDVIDLGVPFWDLHPLNLRNLLFAAPRKFWNLRKAIMRVIREFRPDIVISTGSYEKYALATIRPSSLLGKPCAKMREYHFCSNYRDYLPGKSWVSAIAAAFEHNVLGRMFDMNYLLTREDLETNFMGRRNFDYMYNPVTFAEPPRIPMEDREKVVIAVCRLTDQKNVQAIIRAWASFKDSIDGWKLRIVGDGDQREGLEALAAKLGVADSVEFMGFRPDVLQLLSHSRILAVTSRYEGFGINIVEAMACGTVPVAYRTPYGPADIITHGENGFLVDYMWEEKLAVAIRGLIISPARADQMSKAAVKRARDFAPERIASQWIHKYSEILCRKNK